MITGNIVTDITNAAADEVYRFIKPTTIETIVRYVYQYYEPGGFVRAVLENNLKEAVGRADNENAKALKAIVTYCYMEIPSPCWGSPEKVAAWLERGQRTYGVGTETDYNLPENQ